MTRCHARGGRWPQLRPRRRVLPWLIRRANGEIVAIDGREMAAPPRRRVICSCATARPIPSLARPARWPVEFPAASPPTPTPWRNSARKKFADLSPARRLSKIAEDGFPIDRLYAERRFNIHGRRPSHLRSAEGPALSRGRHAARRRRNAAPAGPRRQPPRTRRTRPRLVLSRRVRGQGRRVDESPRWLDHRGGFCQLPHRPARTRARHRLSGWRGNSSALLPPSSTAACTSSRSSTCSKPSNYAKARRDSRASTSQPGRMKLAFADRAFWLGDPDFVPVPRGLLRKDYARSLAARIQTGFRPGRPHPRRPTRRRDRHLRAEAHHPLLCRRCLRAIGSPAPPRSIRASARRSSSPAPASSSNDQMDDFSVQPGVPQCLPPRRRGGQRHRSWQAPALPSMSPTIVLRATATPSSPSAAAPAAPPSSARPSINLVGVLDSSASSSTPRSRNPASITNGNPTNSASKTAPPPPPATASPPSAIISPTAKASAPATPSAGPTAPSPRPVNRACSEARSGGLR